MGWWVGGWVDVSNERNTPVRCRASVRECIYTYGPRECTRVYLYGNFYLKWHKLMDIIGPRLERREEGRGWALEDIWHFSGPEEERHLTDVHVFDHIAFVSFDK